MLLLKFALFVSAIRLFVRSIKKVKEDRSPQNKWAVGMAIVFVLLCAYLFMDAYI